MILRQLRMVICAKYFIVILKTKEAEEDADPDMEAVSLVCGHQFSAVTWSNYLLTKVEEEGPSCVFLKCQ